MFKVSGKGCNLSSADQKAMNSISPQNFTFWYDLWDRSCGDFCLEQNCPREHDWDMPLNNTRWEPDCYDLKKESRRWQKQKDHPSFQGCLKITRFSWTLTQSVVLLQGILALTYFPRNQNIIVVIVLPESRNVWELLSERHKQGSLKVGDIGIRMLIQIISKYSFKQKCSRWESGISSQAGIEVSELGSTSFTPDIKKKCFRRS